MASSHSDVPYYGGCTCRYLRYQMYRKPLFIHCCHCRWCQRETGAAFALNAMVESSSVVVSSLGDPETVVAPSESGKGQKVSRCPKCRVAIWSIYAGEGEAFRFIRVGTLDHPDLFPPDIHIFTASKQPWVILDDTKPVMKGSYDREISWPKGSLERRLAALNKT